MNNLKMVIVMRKDLNCRKGKLCVQSGHAVLGAYLNGYDTTKNSYWRSFSDEKKICVYVNSEQELFDLYEKCIDSDVNVYLVQDIGLTEFKHPTHTCLAIGPDYSEIIDKITGDLPLL
jgi:PTH2 family peptidyl-tRNA hydrolase